MQQRFTNSIEYFTDEQLVHLILREQAEKVSDKSIADIINGTREELGLTPVAYDRLRAGIELGRRASEPKVRENVRITSTEVAIEYCRTKFHRLIHEGVQEEFHIVCLDTKHKPIESHLITKGTLDASLVHPREVYAPAIKDRSSAILAVHNHPSGDSTPSREDVQVTKRLSDAGNILGISLLDHIVVAADGCVSVREYSG